jgi:hypothetical protein
MQAESTRLVISSLSITQLMVCTIRKDGAIFGPAFMILLACWSLHPFLGAFPMTLHLSYSSPPYVPPQSPFLSPRDTLRLAEEAHACSLNQP